MQLGHNFHNFLLFDAHFNCFHWINFYFFICKGTSCLPFLLTYNWHALLPGVWVNAHMCCEITSLVSTHHHSYRIFLVVRTLKIFLSNFQTCNINCSCLAAYHISFHPFHSPHPLSGNHQSILLSTSLICLNTTPHMTEITQCLSFSYISLSITPLWSIHAATNGKTSFFMAE